jgi:hypothetical protein
MLYSVGLLRIYIYCMQDKISKISYNVHHYIIIYHYFIKIYQIYQLYI